jgi:hypothetical protein
MIETIEFEQPETATVTAGTESEVELPADSPEAEVELAVDGHDDVPTEEFSQEEEIARAERAALVARMAGTFEAAEEDEAEEVTIPAEAESTESVEELAARLARGMVQAPAEEEEFEPEDEGDEERISERGSSKKDKRGRRQLIFDEEHGRVVAKKKRKPGRAREEWEDYID